MNIHQFSNSAVPLPRAELESILGAVIAMQTATGRMAEILLASLDKVDGDPDIEPNGDELDGSLSEDDFCIHNTGSDYGAGCPVSDPGGCEHDGREPEDGR